MIININKQNIKGITKNDKLLIAMPHSSEFDGYLVILSQKLVSDGKHSYAISVYFNDSFTFCLIKYGKGKYNSKKIIDKKTINAEEFKEAFGVMNENIKSSKDDESYLKITEPKKINVSVEVKEELKND